MLGRLWRAFLRLLGFQKTGPGKGNEAVKALYRKKHTDWVSDVTGTVIWVKPVDDKERAERRKRFWVHLWRSFKERFLGAKRDHANRYPHQIFNIEVHGSQLTIRVENNLYTGRELKGVEKGWEVEIGGEYIYNDRGGKLHHTHGNRGYVRRR
jgi:hypothetical protein